MGSNLAAFALTTWKALHIRYQQVDKMYSVLLDTYINCETLKNFSKGILYWVRTPVLFSLFFKVFCHKRVLSFVS
jgi:hypothetical protein